MATYHAHYLDCNSDHDVLPTDYEFNFARKMPHHHKEIACLSESHCLLHIFSKRDTERKSGIGIQLPLV